MQQNSDSDESWTTHEEACYEDVEGTYENCSRKFDKERQNSIKNVWTYFLDSAEHITQLYKDRQYTAEAGGQSCWVPFQTAAGNVTKLYKESCDGMKRSNDLAIQVGYQRRNKELTDWVRSKRRRYIRREDLLSFIAGRPAPPPRAPPLPPPEFHRVSPIHSNNSRLHALRLSPKPAASNANMACEGAPNSSGGTGEDSDSDLHTFKEALALRSRAPELYTFVVGEIARHCKRPASPLDVNMDMSPTLKRPRYSYDP